MNLQQMIQDLNIAMNGIETDSVFLRGFEGKGKVAFKRKSSPTGRDWAMTNYSYDASLGKYSFFWSAYDLETEAEARSLTNLS